jgi:anthranilate synthase component 1
VTPKQYQQLVEQGYNRIPIQREILADLDTPVSAYLKVAKGAYSYLLESVQGGERWGRYSIIGLPAKTVIKIYQRKVQIWQHRHMIQTETVANPLDWVAAYQQQFKVPQLYDLPKFTGGLVGYFGYECIRYIEPRLGEDCHADPLQTPDIVLMLSEELLVFDNLSGKLYCIVHADSAQTDALALAQQRLDKLIRDLAECAFKLETEKRADTVDCPPIEENDFISGFTEAAFQQAVRKIKDYIVAGDVMQVVLSQRLSIATSAQPLNIYRALRTLNPSPYMYYLDLGDFHVVGSSPEVLVCVEQGQITVRPIAGTRPRGATAEDDKRLEQDLLADSKEIAEHLMLIDLGRNDVGRVAQTGTVRVTEKMIVERYSHVMHIVSNVTGHTKAHVNAMDVLKATFPAGTLSGAPKVRALEIIDELEPVKRGVYSGAVGYYAWNGDLNTAIAIRTAVIKDHMLHIQAGAGIVADSLPQSEWDETMNKARAMFKAVAMATRHKTLWFMAKEDGKHVVND